MESITDSSPDPVLSKIVIMPDPACKASEKNRSYLVPLVEIHESFAGFKGTVFEGRALGLTFETRNGAPPQVPAAAVLKLNVSYVFTNTSP